MRNKIIILAVTTILAVIGGVLKIMHRAEPLGDILLAIGLLPYIATTISLMFSRHNINALKRKE